MQKITRLDNGNIHITIPIKVRRNRYHQELVATSGENQNETPLALNIARAFYWQKLIDDGVLKNTKELAQALGMDVSFLTRTIRLRYLSPKIIHAIITGENLNGLGVEKLRKKMPELWSEQEKQWLASK
jgi:hypothetical protein